MGRTASIPPNWCYLVAKLYRKLRHRVSLSLSPVTKGVDKAALGGTGVGSGAPYTAGPADAATSAQDVAIADSGTHDDPVAQLVRPAPESTGHSRDERCVFDFRFFDFTTLYPFFVLLWGTKR